VRRHDLDAALLELGAEPGKLLVLELVLVRVRLENLLTEGTQLLRLVDEGTEIEFSKLGQFSSLLYFASAQNGRLGGATPNRTYVRFPIFLQENLTGLLVRKDFTLHPLQRVVDRLGVAAQLLSHLLVGRALQIET
jgi:hypothetical protein